MGNNHDQYDVTGILDFIFTDIYHWSYHAGSYRKTSTWCKFGLGYAPENARTVFLLAHLISIYEDKEVCESGFLYKAIYASDFHLKGSSSMKL